MAHDLFAELLEKMKKIQAYHPAYFIDQLIIDFELENSGEQIGVIEITMTEKPYQPEGNLKKLAQLLREKGIWGDCFLETDYTPGKAYTQDERISMNCIICVGSEYWSNETKQKRKRMTNAKLLNELENAVKMISGSKCYVSNDAASVIATLIDHPILNKSSYTKYYPLYRVAGDENLFF